MSRIRSQRIVSSGSWMRHLLAWALDCLEVSSSSRLLKPMCLNNDMMQSKSWAWRRICSCKLDKVRPSLASLFLGTDCDCHSTQVFWRYWKAPYQCLSFRRFAKLLLLTSAAHHYPNATRHTTQRAVNQQSSHAEKLRPVNSPFVWSTYRLHSRVACHHQAKLLSREYKFNSAVYQRGHQWRCLLLKKANRLAESENICC